MILNIEKGENNPVLRKKSAPVEEITGEIKRLVSDMTETLKTHDGVGLAAPQVGHNLQIIRIDLSSFCSDPANKKDYQLTLLNPKITKKSWKKATLEEGCLSLPNSTVKVKRPVRVTVQATTLEGKEIEIKADGLLAKVLQHEIDHLSGILISDKT